MHIGRYYSFEILNESEAIKYGDKSFFEHKGTGIPQNTYAFWNVDNLTYPDKKDIKLVFEEKDYDAQFRTDEHGRIRMFWHSDLAEKYNEHPHQQDNYPAIIFTKIGKDKYDVTIVDTPGSTVYNDSNDNIETEVEIIDAKNDVEGKRKIYYSTRYERSSHNRRLAIKYHGCKCMACGFDFEEVYGKIGKGFIEVHHIMPLYRKDEEVVIDPKTDLICLCPNCHRMVHRYKDKVLTLEELKSILHNL
jgi:5-methylcytosine-specific restriction protein A